MWSIPAVTAARSTPIADARSGGALTAHGPANCIAPYPDRLTRLGPSGNVDIGRDGRPGPALRAGRDSDMEFSGWLDGCGRAQGGVHLPDQDLAGVDSTEPTFSGCGKTCSVPRVEQAFRLEVHLAAGDVNVNERRIRDGHAFAGFESRDVQGSVTVPDPDRRLVPVPCHPGRHHRQLALEVGWVQLQLLVSGRDLGLVRDDPHLDQVQRPVGARPVVLLRVPDTGSS